MINKEVISSTDSVYSYLDGEKTLGYLEIRLVDGVVDIMNLFKGLYNILSDKTVNENSYIFTNKMLFALFLMIFLIRFSA